MKLSNIFLIIYCIVLLALPALAQVRTLDEFESTKGRHVHKSEGVEIDTSVVDGFSGKCLRIDFNFVAGGGYGGIQKQIPLELPENYKFTFYLRADAPVNNFEFKLIDKSGDNVWWVNNRNYEFPSQWEKITVKKRHIHFAWGPTKNRELSEVDKIEFIIASSTGGKGSVFLDLLKFEKLEVPSDTIPIPVPSATSYAQEKSSIDHITDQNNVTYWRSKPKPENQEIILDFKNSVEYGGLVIDWDKADFAEKYRILISDNRKDWETAYEVAKGKSGRAYIYLKDLDSRYIKLQLSKSSRGNGYAISELAVKGIEFSENPETFFSHIAGDKPKGFYPGYLYGEQSYWTITGVNSDHKEALINEEGMIEIDKANFSIEPFLFIDNRVITWNAVATSQYLEKDYLPIPSVKWQSDKIELETKIFADGKPDSSFLYLIYKIRNNDRAAVSGQLYLAIRPFQVNTPWQFLNWPGGTAKIKSIHYQDGKARVNDDKSIVALTKPDNFGASEFDQGDIIDFISRNTLPDQQKVTDHFEYASGAFRYDFSLAPAGVDTIYLAVPFYENHPFPSKEVLAGNPSKFVQSKLSETIAFWEDKINTVEFNVPETADRLVNTIRSNLAYILINRDGAGIQPGSRSYERSWIRDGALTSSALLKLGVKKEVREFLDWYSQYQYDSGKIPCVVDHRGADPVPEHDSNGEFIFGILQYFLFTNDTLFLESKFENVKKAVDYLEHLMKQRMTDKYKTGNDSLRAFYGLLPESISHEGYSAKPMHSYWDDFFALKGFKDAVEIARILGEAEAEKRFIALRDTFKVNLYNSIDLAIRNNDIDYIPGCVELGDFDATSTAIAIYPCNEMENLPQPYAQNTFDRYFDYFSNRSQPEFEWRDYTPYEVRLIGTFIYFGQVERAHALLDFFFQDQRPPEWNHWAEVVRKGYHTPGFIGDMPHTWVGSDFISAARAMFVYEDELNKALVIGAGLYQDWIDAPEGMSVRKLPTYYGTLDYSIRQTGAGYRVKLGGDLELPKGKIKIRNFKKSIPAGVQINGKSAKKFDEHFITVEEFSAVVEIRYDREVRDSG